MERMYCKKKVVDLEEDISDWIHTGNIGKLEELVLNGYGDLLLGRTHEVEDNDAVTFLEVLPQYQVFWSLYMWCCFWLFLVLIWKTLFYIGLL